MQLVKILKEIFFHKKIKYTSIENEQEILEEENSYIKQKVLQCVPDFDETFYKEANPDTALLDPYFHYWNYGRYEDRFYKKINLIDSIYEAKINKDKKNVLVVTHDLSRTGCPILSLNIAKYLKNEYNVFALPLKTGKLLEEFKNTYDVVLMSSSDLFKAEILNKELDIFLTECPFLFSYAITNSIISRFALIPIAKHFIPSISLIHEFASYTFPKNSIADSLIWSSKTIFSAQIVLDDNIKYCKELKKYDTEIIPQGICESFKSKENKKKDIEKIAGLIEFKKEQQKTAVILGCGSVHIRKGVDLFLSSSAIILKKYLEIPCKFVWTGLGFDPERDMNYSSYLQDQIIRSNIENDVIFTGEIFNIDQVYEIADILFLSSRLDPLPNVAIEAMSKGIPIVCFDKTTGIADILNQYECGKYCVAPYLDLEKSSELIINLLKNRSLYELVSEAMVTITSNHFNMDSYVSKLIALAKTFTCASFKEKDECEFLLESNCFDFNFFSLNQINTFIEKRDLPLFFIKTWKNGIDLRKPYAGFHPGIYEEQQNIDCRKNNPLTHFIKNGKPPGEWSYELLEINSKDDINSKIYFDNPIALHIHCYTIDTLGDILIRLESQSLPLDLFISAYTDDDLEKINKQIDGFHFNTVKIQKVSNREGSLHSLLSYFANTILERYTFWGHIYTGIDKNNSQEESYWQTYMLEHLLGDKFHAARVILNKMHETPQLGLVFPEDPRVSIWDDANRQLGLKIAQELGLQAKFTRHHNYPTAAMFWSHTVVLKRLLAAYFFWKDYPDDRIQDQSIEQAIMRLLPYIVKQCGFNYLQTYVPNIGNLHCTLVIEQVNK